MLHYIVHGSFYLTKEVIKRYPKNQKYKSPCLRFQWKSLKVFISITNDGIFTKKISRVKEHVLKLWWKFHSYSVQASLLFNFWSFSSFEYLTLVDGKQKNLKFVALNFLLWFLQPWIKKIVILTDEYGGWLIGNWD